MAKTQVGLLHPGQMGATVGVAAQNNGADVLWASEGRSANTRSRAEGAGLKDVETLSALVERADMIVSVCPPARAETLARSVMALGFDGLYVDANAVSPQSARSIESVIRDGGAEYVDGGIIGPPAVKTGSTRLYLSGEQGEAVAKVFAGSVFDAVVLAKGSASALKMTYAAYTKGLTALLLDIRALANAEDVDDALLNEWNLSQPGLVASSESAAKNNAYKAWRFAGEMREIADTFHSAGLPDGFHRAAADVYDRLAEFKDCETAPSVGEVAEALLAGDRTLFD